MPVVLSLVLLLAAVAEPSTSGSVGYYRFPAIHGDTIVFGAEGDLWQVSRSGGVAARLTSHPADEAYPAISPDGATLAFSEASRAVAFLHGRGYVVPEDVKEIAKDVLRHRVLLTYEAEAENVTSDTVVERILERVEVP